MGLRPGRCYRSKKDRAYTRLAVTVHDKNYIGAAPGLRVRPGQKILSILVDEIHIEFARKALKRAMSKICSTAHVVVGTDVKSIGTKPRKSRLEMLEKKEEEEAAAKAAAKPTEAGKAEGAEAKPGAEGKAPAAEAGKTPAADAGKAPAAGKGAEKKPEAKGKDAGKK